MFRFLFFSAALFCIASANIVDDVNCGSISTLHAVEFTGCTKFPCVINDGSEYTLSIRFTPSQSMVVKSRITYQWDGFAPEMYDEIDDFVTGGQVHTHTKAGITVSAPQSWGITFKWELIDTQGRSQICAHVISNFITGQNIIF